MISQKFEFWAKFGKNVVLIGHSGVGKTALIRESLEHFGYKFGESIAYYSTHANDFVGDLATAKVVLFDNLNDPQSQKAAHEVMGLRVWKGVPVVGFVWGAWTSPIDEGGYEPEPPEIINAFEVKIEVPHRPNLQYLTDKFGDRLANAAYQWWDDLGDDYKYKYVSPRALTEALLIYQQRGDMRDILPVNSNVSRLVQILNSGPIIEKLDQLLKSNNEVDAKNWLSIENNYAASMKYITKSPTLMAYFLPLLSEFRLQHHMADDDKVLNFVLESVENNIFFNSVCKKIINEKSNTNIRLKKKIRRFLENKQNENLNQ